MHIIKSNIHGNPNVGLYGIAIAGKLLFGEKLRTKQREQYEQVLGVELVRCRIAGTDLPGAFLAGNSKTLLVPSITFEHELRVLQEHNIPFTLFETNVTCLGNTIACNDNGAIVSTEFSEEEVAQISKALGVPCVRLDVAGLTTPGAVIVVHDGHAIVHKDASPEDVALIEKTLQVTVEPATVNLGSPHLRAGILHSEKGLVVGDLSGGPEIVHIDEALGYHIL